jgi:hypothetical protein
MKEEKKDREVGPSKKFRSQLFRKNNSDQEL